MIPGLIWSLGCGRSLWTNWRWTNFSLSYQLPLRLKGHPGYWRNLELIHMGFCEPRVTKSLVDFLCPLVSPRKCHASIPEWCASFYTLLRRLRFPTTLPRVTRWMEGVASLSPLLGPIYIVHSLPCPLLLLSIPFLPYRPRASSNSLPSSIRYFLSLFRFLAYLSSLQPCLRLVV